MEKVKNIFKDNYKKIILGIVLVSALGFAGNKFLSKGKSAYPEISKAETSLLTKKNFVSQVTESGKAKSETTRNVYAEKMLAVKEIHVEVGDTVKAGDTIAVLDDSTIRQQLELKESQIAAVKKSSGPQIKSARDRLEEAIRNRDQGTGSQLVSAQNAVMSAFDAWQSAEKTFENLNNSMATGYNEILNSQLANEKSLENAQITTDLNYQQAQNNLERLQSDITKFANLATGASRELDDLKYKDSILERRISDITKELETANATVGNNEDIVKKELEIVTLEAQLRDENISPEKLNELNLKIANLKDELYLLRKAVTITTTTPNASIDQLTRDLESVQKESKEIKERIAEVQGDKAKFEGELEAAQKSIGSQIDLVNQNKLQLEISQDNRESAAIQKDSARKNLEDQLRMARKNADDAKNQYEAALKNLEVAKIMTEDEIKALQNSLNIANAGADNTMNYVEIKYLKEDLEKTVIKAPIDGTITAVNMIKGQTPTDYVAKIETVNHLIVETQVKEFDVNRVRVGMKVEVTSDALPLDTVIDGEVESINPTAIQTLSGTATGEVAYKVIVTLKERSEEIKPDMNVKVRYIIEKLENVYAVPSNSIYEKNGKFFMLIIDDKEISTVREMEVTVKTNNEYESVITSPELNDKIRVINSPDLYSPGTELRLTDENLEIKGD